MVLKVMKASNNQQCFKVQFYWRVVINSFCVCTHSMSAYWLVRVCV